MRLFRADVQRLSLRRAIVDEKGANFFMNGLSTTRCVRLGAQSARWSCDCADYQRAGKCERNCKHIFFVKMRVLAPKGLMTVWDDENKIFLRRSILAMHADAETASRVFRAVERHQEEIEAKGLARGNPKYLLAVLPRPSDGPDVPRPVYESLGIPETRPSSDADAKDSEDESEAANVGKKRRR